MEVVAFEIHRAQFFVSHFYLWRVLASVKTRLQPQAGARLCGRDQLYNDFVTDQRSTPPVHADMREEPMLDLVPLAGSRRKMANSNLEARVVGESLQLNLPEARSVTIASASVGTDEQFRGTWVETLFHAGPPTSAFCFQKEIWQRHPIRS